MSTTILLANEQGSVALLELNMTWIHPPTPTPNPNPTPNFYSLFYVLVKRVEGTHSAEGLKLFVRDETSI